MDAEEVRAQVLRHYYDLEQETPTKSAQTGEVADALGIDEAQVSGAIAYLQQKGLLKVLSSVVATNYPVPLYIAQITAAGIDQIDAQSSRAKKADVGSRSIVFISCGQYTEEERNLGTAIAASVDELTPHHGYFAQNVSRLETLSTDILNAIQQCVGFVAVMHNRGDLQTPKGKKIRRASVWVEQELAIAAFIQQRLGRDIEVQAYLENGVSREGLRQQLHLNETLFNTSAEVIEDFRKRLKGGAFGATAGQYVSDEERRHRESLQPRISILPEKIKNESRDDRFAVVLRNDGSGSAFNIKIDTGNSSDGKIVYNPPPTSLPKDGRHILITKHPETRTEIVPITLTYEDQFGQEFESKSGRDFALGSKYEFRRLTKP